MSLYNVIFKRKTIENPAKINLKNIWKFLQGTFFRIVNAFRDSGYRKEQMDWRRKLVEQKSPECFNTKVCYCGCDLEGLIAANPECEQKNHCFPEMMSKKEWKTFKLKNNI